MSVQPDPPRTATDSHEGALHALLQVHEDLKLWLEHTGYFNEEHRRAILDGVRELHSIDAQRAKVLHKLHQSQPAHEQATAMHVTPMLATAVAPKRRLAPKPRKSGTRYFIIKSSSTSGVFKSQQGGIWMTQKHNEQLLTEAFHQSEEVFLLFSINKSKAFQGYARMTSAPDSSIRKPEWMREVDLRTTPAFRVEWLNKKETRNNSFGNEVSEAAARAMMLTMDCHLEPKGKTVPPPPPKQAKDLPFLAWDLEKAGQSTDIKAGLATSKWKADLNADLKDSDDALLVDFGRGD